jgi:hypothetical protein
MTVAEGPWSDSSNLGDGGDGRPPSIGSSGDRVSEVLYSLHERAIDGLAGALDLCRDDARTLWERFVASGPPASAGQPAGSGGASNASTDGGAVAVGIPTYLLPPAARRRARGLDAIIELVRARPSPAPARHIR